MPELLRRHIVLTCFLIIIFSLSTQLTPVHAQVGNIIVNTNNTSIINDSLCGLIEAIIAANTDTAGNGCPAGSGADTIELEAGQTYNLTSVNNNSPGANGLPQITSEIIIDGKGSTIKRDSLAPHFRIFHVATTGDLTLNDLTISGGRMSGVAGSTRDGAGIENRGILQVTNSVITDNHAQYQGGGIDNIFGSVEIINSTISGNSANYGAGIYTWDSTTSLTNSTVSNNTANIRTGGIENNIGVLTLTNTIIANSLSGADCYNDFAGTVTYVGMNIIEDGGCNAAANAQLTGDPRLGVLADNGGSTLTHEILTGSNAINVSVGGTSSDQRGATSIGIRDIGAYEFGGLLPEVSFSIDQVTLTEGAAVQTATVTVTATNFTSAFDISFVFSGSSISADYTTTYAGRYTISASGNTTFTIDIVDDVIVETPETLILELLQYNRVAIAGTNPQAISLISKDGAYVLSTIPDTVSPNIELFDPAISKLGFLVPGQIGVTGERLEWVISVRNPSNVTGQNVVITDIVDSRLQINSVNAPSATTNISGQVVTITYATLNPSQTVIFSIFTTVLDGVQVNNTACVSAINQGEEECFTGSLIGELPMTGESPLFRQWFLIFVIGTFLSGAGYLFFSRHKQ